MASIDVAAGLTSALKHAAELVESDPRAAMRVAGTLRDDARDEHDPASGAIAAFTLGLASGRLGDLDGATTYYRQAIEMAERADSPMLQGEIRTAMALVLAYLGRGRSALQSLETGVRELHGVHRAHARAQRGAVLAFLGRSEAALADYRSSLAVLRRADDDLWTLRVLVNRGNLLTHRHAFVPALADLNEAKELGEKRGFPIIVGNVEHNLGWLETYRGHIPDALRHLDLADERYTAFGFPRGPLLCDRSQVLLSARLLDEARHAAMLAIEASGREHRLGTVAEARLLLARTERLQGDVTSALANANTAAREFRRLDQPTWAGLARVLAMTWRAEREPGYAAHGIDAAIEASQGLWPDATLDAIIAVGRSAIDAGRVRRGRSLLRRAAAGRQHGPAFLRSRAWYAEALERYTVGNARGAVTAVRTGLRALDKQVAGFGSADVRAHVAGHRVQLARLGVRIALEASDPARVLEWSELGRASHLLRVAMPAADDVDVEESLAELRVVVRDLERGATSTERADELARRQATLEREIRDHQRHRLDNNSDSQTRFSSRDFAETLDDRALVEFTAHDGQLHAVCQVGEQLTLRTVGNTTEIEDLQHKLRFGLRRMAHPAYRAARAADPAGLVRAAARRLDEILLRAFPQIGDRSMVLIPTGVLHSMPWSVLPSVIGRPLTVSPSASLWQAAQSRLTAPGHVLAAAGPDLPHATTEAEQVAGIYAAAALTGAAATAGAVLADLDSAAVAHLAAHGRVRADNALFGSLGLADGPLMIYDLERLARAPHTVIVAACDAGRPIVPAGDELLGLTATLLAQGTTQLIASSVPVLDAHTVPLMVDLHSKLAVGQPAAEALATAQQHFAAGGAQEFATAASYVCFGAGFVSAPLAGGSFRSGSTR